MRKKSGFIPIFIGIEQAIVLVPEFEKVVRKLELKWQSGFKWSAK